MIFLYFREGLSAACEDMPGRVIRKTYEAPDGRMAALERRKYE